VLPPLRPTSNLISIASSLARRPPFFFFFFLLLLVVPQRNILDAGGGQDGRRPAAVLSSSSRHHHSLDLQHGSRRHGPKLACFYGWLVAAVLLSEDGRFWHCRCWMMACLLRNCRISASSSSCNHDHDHQNHARPHPAGTRPPSNGTTRDGGNERHGSGKRIAKCARTGCGTVLVAEPLLL